MNKRRASSNGHVQGLPDGLATAAPPEALVAAMDMEAPAASLDIVMPAGLDGGEAETPEIDGAGPTDTAGPPELAAGDGEIGNTLQTYLREIRRAPLLTPQQEFETATRARMGDFEARQAMRTPRWHPDMCRPSASST